MKFGYTTVYVASVPDTLIFYQKAFGFATRFLHESSQYGELETGGTVIAFASHTMGYMNLRGRYRKVDVDTEPFGVQLAFVTDDVATSYVRALAAGAMPVKGPAAKPWGQIVAYVRDKDGSLIELRSPVGD